MLLYGDKKEDAAAVEFAKAAKLTPHDAMEAPDAGFAAGSSSRGTAAHATPNNTMTSSRPNAQGNGIKRPVLSGSLLRNS